MSGVLPGTGANDAVNFTQHTALVNQVQATTKLLSRGIASTTAIANIPQVEPGKQFAMGAGVGNYNGETALAIGGSYRVNDTTVLKANVGYAGGKAAVGAGAAWSW